MILHCKHRVLFREAGIEKQNSDIFFFFFLHISKDPEQWTERAAWFSSLTWPCMLLYTGFWNDALYPMQFPVLWFGLVLTALCYCDEKQIICWSGLKSATSHSYSLSYYVFSTAAADARVLNEMMCTNNKKKQHSKIQSIFCGWACLCCKSPHTVVRAHCRCCYFYRCGFVLSSWGRSASETRWKRKQNEGWLLSLLKTSCSLDTNLSCW